MQYRRWRAGLLMVAILQKRARCSGAYCCLFRVRADSIVQIGLRLLSRAVVSPALLFAISFWMPESPRWLIMKQQTQAGLETLKRLHQTADDPNNILAHEEYHQICGQLALEAEKPSTFWRLIRYPSYRRRFLLAFFLQYISDTGWILSIYC